MIKFFILLSSLISFPVFSQIIETNWLINFKKELSITCDPNSSFCHDLCSTESVCYIEEGICRNCIGTGLKINYILSELGRSIHSSEEFYDSGFVINFLKNNSFASLSSKDPYNVIDAFGSIKVYKKFESLCQEGSLSQILFLKLSPLDRSILRPEFVYCEYENGVTFNKLKTSPELETSLRQLRFLTPF